MIRHLLEHSRGFLVVLLICGMALFVRAALDLGGRLPDRDHSELKSRTNLTDIAVMVRDIQTLFAPTTLTSLKLATNGVSAFHTTHFQPPPPPPAPEKKTAPAETKSAPKTVQITFQGVYQTASGENRAFIKVGDNVVVATAGTKVVQDWTVAEISPHNLILKNAAGQTIALEFNKSKEIEIPKQ